MTFPKFRLPRFNVRQGIAVKQLPAMLSCIMLVVSSVAIWICGGALINAQPSTSIDGWIVGAAVTVFATACIYLSRALLAPLAVAGINGLLRLLAFPVVFIAEQAWWVYFGLPGCTLVYALFQLSDIAAPGSRLDYYLLFGSVGALAVGALYHLIHHRWAGTIAVAAALPLLAAGCYLLTYESGQVSVYNQATAYRQSAGGKPDLVGQLKLIDASLSEYDKDTRQTRLWQTVFPEPPLAVAARTHFHRANLLISMPNKGKEAFEELTRSLGLNPGNFYGNLSRTDMESRAVDARDARRNLEKLIRSGQDGGAGTPNQPGRPGQQGQQPSDQREPGKQPVPGAGRLPSNTL